MPETRNDDDQPWPFWLVETNLPHDEDDVEPQPMSDRQFYFGLIIALAIVVAAGMLVRGCSI